MIEYNGIESIIRDLESSIEDLVQETVIDIFVDSQLNCPVESGRLKDSGQYDKNSVEYTTEYAPYVEMEHGFLRNAYLDNTNDLQEKVTKTVQDAINRNKK